MNLDAYLLLKKFVELYVKLKSVDKLSMLDKDKFDALDQQLFDILEEYDYIIEFYDGVDY